MVVTLLFYFLQAKTTFCFTIFIYCKLQILRKLQKFSGSGFLPVCRVLYLLAFPWHSKTGCRIWWCCSCRTKVGAQIESISWMTSDGFASAVNSFIAQNHGAGKEDRIHAGYRSALKIVLPWGLFCTILLVCFPTPIFKIFITEPDVIPMGISYLMILGFSQLFTSLEITTSGAFCGYGRTLRLPLSELLWICFESRWHLHWLQRHWHLAESGGAFPSLLF